MGTKIDGRAGSSDLDSSGEILDVEGADIADLIEGKGVFNWEHSANADDVVGKILYAKKIYKRDDCDNARQERYWDLSKKPYIYIIGELFDDEDNVGAVAIASMIRYAIKNEEKLLIGYSVEGATLKRDDNVLKRSVIRKVAITLKSCNKTAIAEHYDGLDKAEAADAIVGESLFKSLMSDFASLNKALAPSNMVGESANAIEDPSLHRRVREAIDLWDRKRPLRDVIKAALPEVSDEYVDYFTDVADKMSLKKSSISTNVRLNSHHLTTPTFSPEQEDLLEGLQITPEKSPVTEHAPLFMEPIQNDENKKVVVSLFQNNGDSAYRDVAKDAGLADNVPVTANFKHLRVPAPNDQHYHAMHLPDDVAGTGYDPALFDKAIGEARANGDLHKLMLIDLILGCPRYYRDILLGKTIYHVHNRPFTPGTNAYDNVVGDDLIHVGAKDWLNSVDAKTMAKTLNRHGVHRQNIMTALQRLQSLKMNSHMPLAQAMAIARGGVNAQA
jgi:hypothetical protein